jgi:hypothetical protein
MLTDRADSASPVPVKLLVPVLIILFAVFVCWKNTLEFPDTLHWSAWSLSEWLINYQGGFVRRGLAGQIIRLLAGDGGRAIAIVNGAVFSIFTSLCGLLLCLIALSRRVTPLMAVMLLLVPGGIYGMVMGNGFYFRKEMVFHVYLAAVATLFLLAVRSEGSGLSRTLRVLTIALIVIGSAALPFVHEAFLFMTAAPSGVIVYWLARRSSKQAGRNAAAAYLAVVVVQFVLLATFKGNEATASAIWASIHPDDQKLIRSDGVMDGGILAIGWSVRTAAMLPLKLLASGYAWNWAFIIVASAGYLVATALADRGPVNEAYRRAAWVATLYGICLAGSLPLYIIGWDWGRWIAALNMSVVILICAGQFENELPVPVGALLTARISYSRTLISATLCLAILFGLTFNLPECCLEGLNEPFYRLILKLVGHRP